MIAADTVAVPALEAAVFVAVAAVDAAPEVVVAAPEVVVVQLAVDHMVPLMLQTVEAQAGELESETQIAKPHFVCYSSTCT
jgi:hypothetical protein